MCRACWDEDGDSPDEWTPQTARFIELYRRLYNELDCSTGGPLHLVLDDWNIEDSSLAFCRNACAGDDWDDEQRTVCFEILDIMDRWTMRQRSSALAYEMGFLSTPDAAR